MDHTGDSPSEAGDVPLSHGHEPEVGPPIGEGELGGEADLVKPDAEGPGHDADLVLE